MRHRSHAWALVAGVIGLTSLVGASLALAGQATGGGAKATSSKARKKHRGTYVYKSPLSEWMQDVEGHTLTIPNRGSLALRFKEIGGPSPTQGPEHLMRTRYRFLSVMLKLPWNCQHFAEDSSGEVTVNKYTLALNMAIPIQQVTSVLWRGSGEQIPVPSSEVHPGEPYSAFLFDASATDTTVPPGSDVEVQVSGKVLERRKLRVVITTGTTFSGSGEQGKERTWCGYEGFASKVYRLPV